MIRLSDEEIRVLKAIIDRGAVTLPRKGSESMRRHHIPLYWTLDGLTLRKLLIDQTDDFTTTFSPTDRALALFDKPKPQVSSANRGRWDREPL